MAIYKVTTPKGVWYVKSNTKAVAVNHCIRPGVSAEPLSPDEVAELYESGVKPEVVSADDEKAD